MCVCLPEGLTKCRPAEEWGEQQVGNTLMSQCPDCHGLYLVPIPHTCAAEEAQYTLPSDSEGFLARLIGAPA